MAHCQEHYQILAAQTAYFHSEKLISFDQKFYADLNGVFCFGTFTVVIGKKAEKDTNL